MFLGYFPIADSYQLTFYFQFVNTTGSAANPTSPTWRMYEQNSGTVVTNSTLSQLDTSGGGATVPGLYYGQVTIASGTGTGMEDDKEYVIRGTGTVDGETPAGIHVFRTGYAPANARQISGDTSAADNLEAIYETGGSSTAVMNVKQLNVVNSTGDAVVFSSTGSDGRGLAVSGNGLGAGATIQGGATDGDAIQFLADAVAPLTGTARGVVMRGAGGGQGLRVIGGPTNGAAALFDGSNGSGAQVTIGTSANGITVSAVAAGHGIDIQSGTGSGTSGIRSASRATAVKGHGFHAVGSLGGAGVFGDGGAGVNDIGSGMELVSGLGAGAGPALFSHGQVTGAHGARFLGFGSGHGQFNEGGSSGGEGTRSVGGSGGNGGSFLGGLNGRGILAQSQSGSAPGLESIGSGTGAGVLLRGGATNGDGLQLEATGTGNALEAVVAAGEPLSQNIEDQLVNPILAAIAAISPSAIADAVWDELLSGHPTLGSAGYLLHNAFKILRNRLKIDGGANTLTIYDDDETTPIFVYNTKDSLGAPSTTTIFERDPV